MLIFVFAMLGFLVMGYHPGIEDDGVYLAAIKADLRPTLYPHDSDFFRLQLQATVFDRWMANFVAIGHIPLAYAELLWQFASLVCILWAAHSIAQRLFRDECAQWAGVALLSAMFTLPVAGTALYLIDQHLHPRAMATALILFAISSILNQKTWRALALLLAALVVHPIMGAFGISFSCILILVMAERVTLWVRPDRASAAGAAPLAWMFEPASPTWREALATRSYYFLSRWSWYELLGAFAPLFLFGALHVFARRRGASSLARFALAVLIYGIFQQAVALVMLGPPALIRLTPLQPMRFLHLVYVFMVLIGGCLIGQFLLKAHPARWALFLLVMNAGMFAAQRSLFANSPHIEWPGRAPGNAWLQAFQWIRENTPETAYFALDPYYLDAPGEDAHSFRALAERSQLADSVKDTAVVTQVPELGPRWLQEKQAQSGWQHFKATDFEHLKTTFGVGWVLVLNAQTDGLNCKWHNESLSVCQVP